MLKPWKQLKSEYILDNRWIKLSKREFLLPNGNLIPDYYIVEKPDIVLIVPITSDGRTMIMREFERGVQAIGYKFPAGRVNDKESPMNAARREFLEETGLSIGNLAPIGVLDADPGWLTTKVHVFIAEVFNEISDPKPDPEELFETEWVSFNNFGNKIIQGEVHNIFVVAAYHLAEKYLSQNE